MSIGMKMSKAIQVINKFVVSSVHCVWFEVSWHCDDEPLFDATGPSYRVGLAENSSDWATSLFKEPPDTGSVEPNKKGSAMCYSYVRTKIVEEMVSVKSCAVLLFMGVCNWSVLDGLTWVFFVKLDDQNGRPRCSDCVVVAWCDEARC